MAKNQPKKEAPLSKEEVKKATNELITKSTFEQKRIKRLADAKQKELKIKKTFRKKTSNKKDQ